MLHLLWVFAFTWMLKVPEVQKTDWKPSTYTLQDKMVKLGWSCTNSKLIINQCKKTAKDPKRCILAAAAIGLNETNACKYAYQNSCFWLQKSYNSAEESIKDFVKTYNRFWYKYKDWSFFYGHKWISPKSHFCMSEKSSGAKGWCPNWLKHFEYFVNKLK